MNSMRRPQPFFTAHILLTMVLALILMPTASRAEGLNGRIIVGYQGWFGCPNDFENNGEWQHWFEGKVSPERFVVDLLPSVPLLEPADLCDTGLPRADGSGTIKLFSSQDPRVVREHFHLMAANRIDAAAVQRFVGPITHPQQMRRSDNVMQNAMAAAEAEKLDFFVVYDVSGANPNTVTEDIRRDWRHLVQDLKLTRSPAYLQDGGKPVLALWGFGFNDRPGEPGPVAALVADLKMGSNGLAAATLIGGVPSGWRTLSGDSRPEAAWTGIYRSYDVLKPWMVGRFGDDAGAESFLRTHVLPDIKDTRARGQRYMPVIFPGFSWFNLQTTRGRPGLAIHNQVPRRCGTFLWSQAVNMLTAGADTLYVAMFDEVDEGTAIMPTVTTPAKLPRGAQMVYLNEDGCALPDDWYLRITGRIADYLHTGERPPKSLDAVIRP